MPITRALFVPVCILMAIFGAHAAEPIVVIAPFNMTGPEAVLDAPCYRGAELAEEKLNAQVASLAGRFNWWSSTRPVT